MGKVKQNVVKGLQLDHKWVRVMLIVSVLAIVIILFFPTLKKTEEAMPITYNKAVLDTTVVTADSSRMRILIRRQPTNIVRHLPAAPAPGTEVNKSVDNSNDTTVAAKSEPIQIQIVEPKKSFDWKGTATWAIGALNGLILVFLNIKNLLFKKNP